MSLDLNTIVSSMVGSLAAISGSIAAAVLFIRNQDKSEDKRRLHERIQETYFEKGILPMEGALSKYGTSTVFAFSDTVEIPRIKHGKRQTVETLINERGFSVSQIFER
jgi:hypothetical protein